MDLSTLNEAQRAAATAGPGAHRVIAGAGTGKTRALVYRVAHLIEQGVAPENIVLLTFTRRAAREMLHRASQEVGARAHGVRGGTFHSFAHRTLRRHAEAIGRTPQFTVLDSGDAEELVGLARGDLGLGGRGNRRFPQASVLAAIFSRATNTGRSLADTLEAFYPRHVDDLADIARVRAAYEERKAASDALDFDDLLVHLARLLAKNERARRDIAGACHHVLVDEYQDVNKLQARIACMLAVVHGNILVVGDEAQSIYAFRGASVENILDFPKLFPAAETTLLTDNYRSTDSVVTLANGVLQSARTGIKKTLVSQVGSGPRPRLVEVEDEQQQADTVVTEVLDLRENNVPLVQQAVLARSTYQLTALELALTRANIPYRKHGGLRLSEAAHVKDTLAILRVSVNPRDTLAWLRVLPWCENIGRTTAQKLAEARGAGETRPLRSLVRRAAPELDVVEQLIAEVATHTQHPGAALATAIDGLRPFFHRRYDDADERIRELESLLSLTDRFEDVPRLVAELSLEPPQRGEAVAADDEDEQLTLSTIHSAKGLEWNAVFVVGLGDGAFPSGYSLDDPEAMEEERRLLYVAVTRARRHLTLLQPRFASRRSGPVFTPSCRLLEDIPDLWTRIARAWPAARNGPSTEPTATAAPEVNDRLARFADYFGDD